eukprot:5181899-Pyramimonas_sp.AAC.1
MCFIPGDAEAERMVRFVVTFATHQDAGHEEEAEEFLEQFVTTLVSHSEACSKHVRYRVCQIVAGIFEGEPEVSEDLWEEVKTAMMARLRDKIAAVRMQAARALSRMQIRIPIEAADGSLPWCALRYGSFSLRFEYKALLESSGRGEISTSPAVMMDWCTHSRLQEPAEEEEEEGQDLYANDPIVRTYLEMLEVEKNKDVRKALLGSVVCSESTLRIVVERTRMPNPEVSVQRINPRSWRVMGRDGTQWGERGNLILPIQFTREKSHNLYIRGLMESNEWKTPSDKTLVFSRSPPHNHLGG